MTARIPGGGPRCARASVRLDTSPCTPRSVPGGDPRPRWRGEHTNITPLFSKIRALAPSPTHRSGGRPRHLAPLGTGGRRGAREPLHEPPLVPHRPEARTGEPSGASEPAHRYTWRQDEGQMERSNRRGGSEGTWSVQLHGANTGSRGEGYHYCRGAVPGGGLGAPGSAPFPRARPPPPHRKFPAVPALLEFHSAALHARTGQGPQQRGSQRILLRHPLAAPATIPRTDACIRAEQRATRDPAPRSSPLARPSGSPQGAVGGASGPGGKWEGTFSSSWWRWWSSAP